MTATIYVGGFIRGTAAERGAYTTTNLRAGWIWFESDTFLAYYWNGSSWNLILGYASPLAVNQGGTGAATLTGILKGNGTSAVTAGATVTVAEGGTGATTLTGVLKGNGTSAVTAAAQLAIADGGTGAGTATAAYDALSAMSALGDIQYGGASGTRTRLAGQTNNIRQVLTQTGTGSASAAPAWTVPPVFPSSRKWGVYQGDATTAADGIWAGGMTSIGTATGVLFDTTNGSKMIYTTGGTSGNPAGQRYSNPSASMAFNARLKVKFVQGSTTNNATYIGFLGTAADFAATDDPFASARGICVGARSTDAVYIIGSGENTANGTYVNYNADGIGGTLSVTNGVHTVEIIMISSTNFSVRIDANSWHTVTSPLPNNAAALYYCSHIHQSATEAGHTLAIFYAEVELDK